MKASEILYKAAELVAKSLDKNATVRNTNHVAGCKAIKLASQFPYRQSTIAAQCAKEYYASLFSNEYIYWFGNPLVWSSRWKINKNAQKHRLMALLLTAAIAESVGD